MARKRPEPGLKQVTVSDRRGGEVEQWEATVDTGDAGGRRKQSRKRFGTKREAKAWRDGILADRARGTHVTPATMTMATAVEDWLASRRNKQATTLDAYTAALRPVIEVLGEKPVQKVTVKDIDALVQALIDGTTPRGQWSPTSINPMLARLRTVFDWLQAQGVVARNPARLVENVGREDTPDKPPPMYVTYTPEDVKTLLKSVLRTEDSVLCIMAMLGFRRGEIAGMRWSSVDLVAGTIAVERTVTVSSKGTKDSDRTKTASSRRTLPLPTVALKILRAATDRRDRDKATAGSAWRGEPDGHVFRQELGEGYHPRTIDARWERALKAAGTPKMRLHDGRHTAATLLHLDGATAAITAAWLGHASAATTMRIYTHAQDAQMLGAAGQLHALFDLDGAE